MVATLAAAVLAGLGWGWLGNRLGGRKQLLFVGVTVVLISLEFWTAPFKLANNYVPAVYNQISQDNTAKAILELPLQRNAWDYPRRMYFATVHGKNILQGYTSRVEATPLPPENMPGVRQVLYNDLQPDITYDDSRQAARAFFDFYGLGYVVIDNGGVGAKTLQNTPKMLDQLFEGTVETRWPQDNITSYRVPLMDSAQTLTTPLLVPGANWYLAEKSPAGQYRWMGSTGRLLALVPSQGAGNLKLQLQGSAFVKTRTLALQDDQGHEVARLAVGTENKLYESPGFNLPGGANWLNLVSLDGTDTPANLATPDKPSQDKRTLSVLVYKLRLTS